MSVMRLLGELENLYQHIMEMHNYFYQQLPYHPTGLPFCMISIVFLVLPILLESGINNFTEIAKNTCENRKNTGVLCDGKAMRSCPWSRSLAWRLPLDLAETTLWVS